MRVASLAQLQPGSSPVSKNFFEKKKHLCSYHNFREMKTFSDGHTCTRTWSVKRGRRAFLWIVKYPAETTAPLILDRSQIDKQISSHRHSAVTDEHLLTNTGELPDSWVWTRNVSVKTGAHSLIPKLTCWFGPRSGTQTSLCALTNKNGIRNLNKADWLSQICKPFMARKTTFSIGPAASCPRVLLSVKLAPDRAI